MCNPSGKEEVCNYHENRKQFRLLDNIVSNMGLFLPWPETIIQPSGCRYHTDYMVESIVGDDKSIIKQVMQNGDKRGKRPKQGNKVEMRMRISRITSSQFLLRKMDLNS